MSALPPSPPSGPLRTGALARALAWARDTRASACLVIRSAGAVNRLYVEEGRPASAVLAQGYVPLAQLLVEKHFLDDAALDKALEEVYGGLPIEEAVIKTGVMTEARLLEALAAQELHHLHLLAELTEGELEVVDEAAPAAARVRLSAERALLDVLAAPGSAALADERLALGEQAVRLTSAFDMAEAALGLSDAERGAVPLLRGGVAPRTFASDSGLGAEQARALLTLLLELKLAEPVDLAQEAEQRRAHAERERAEAAFALAQRELALASMEWTSLVAAAKPTLRAFERTLVAEAVAAQEREAARQRWWDAARAVEATLAPEPSSAAWLHEREAWDERLEQADRAEQTRIAFIEARDLGQERERRRAVRRWNDSVARADARWQEERAEAVVAREEVRARAEDLERWRDAVIDEALRVRQIEAEALVAERVRQARRDAEILAEQERVEAEERAAEGARREAERRAAEQREAERLRAAQELQLAEAVRLEAERQAAEEVQRQAAERAAEEARVEAERQAAEAAQREAQERAAEEAQRKAERQEAERQAAEAERLAAEAAQLEARLEAEREAAEAARRETERQEAETARREAERAAAEEARIEAERAAAEEARLEAERVAAEEARLEAQRQAAEEARLEAERVAAEEARREAERQEAERQAANAARAEAERLAAEAARAEAERRAAEEARVEAQRQAAEEARVEAERLAAEAAREAAAVERTPTQQYDEPSPAFAALQARRSDEPTLETESQTMEGAGLAGEDRPSSEEIDQALEAPPKVDEVRPDSGAMPSIWSIPGAKISEAPPSPARPGRGGSRESTPPPRPITSDQPVFNVSDLEVAPAEAAPTQDVSAEVEAALARARALKQAARADTGPQPAIASVLTSRPDSSAAPPSAEPARPPTRPPPLPVRPPSRGTVRSPWEMDRDGMLRARLSAQRRVDSLRADAYARARREESRASGRPLSNPRLSAAPVPASRGGLAAAVHAWKSASSSAQANPIAAQLRPPTARPQLSAEEEAVQAEIQRKFDEQARAWLAEESTGPREGEAGPPDSLAGSLDAHVPEGMTSDLENLLARSLVRPESSPSRAVPPKDDELEFRFQSISQAASDDPDAREVESLWDDGDSMATEEDRARKARLRLRGLQNLGAIATPTNAPLPEPVAPPPAAAPAAPSRPVTPAGDPTVDEKKLAEEIKAKHAVFKAEDYFQRLGLARGATPEQIKGAYFGMVKRFHPDKLPPSLSGQASEVKEIFAALREAYDTLSRNKERLEYLATLSRPPSSSSAAARPAKGAPAGKREVAPEAAMEAKKLRTVGDVSLRKKAFAEAERAYAQAYEIENAPNDLAGQAWAIYLDPARKDDLIRVKELLRTALAADPNSDRAHYVSGVIARAANDIAEAERQFQAAVKANPQNTDAALELRVLARRKEKEKDDGATPGKKKGLFGR